jgi:hypothetical protein
VSLPHVLAAFDERGSLAAPSFEGVVLNILGGFMRAIVLCLLALCLYAVIQKVFTTHPADVIKGVSLLQTDASGYVQKMAARIVDAPQCQVFKDRILAHAGDPPYNGGTYYKIGLIKNEANKAGCSTNQ